MVYGPILGPRVYFGLEWDPLRFLLTDQWSKASYLLGRMSPEAFKDCWLRCKGFGLYPQGCPLRNFGILLKSSLWDVGPPPLLLSSLEA